MMPAQAKQPRSHKGRWLAMTACVLILALVAGLAWYWHSSSFENLVREKLVTALEDATGGRVEMASLHWNLSALAFTANNLTIHGLEAPDQVPYLHVDRVLVRLHIISLLERRFNVELVQLQHPTIHIIVNPDGSTNAPTPKVRTQATKSAVQDLFDLATNRADFQDGMLIINDRKLPLDFSANDVLARMTYDASAQRFDGRVQVGKIDVKYGDFRDLPAATDLQFSLWRDVAEIKSLRLTSRDSALQASGKVTGFNQPKVQLAYNSTIDLSQMAAVTRTPGFRGGTLLLDGSVQYANANDYNATGHSAFRNLVYENGGVALRQTNLDTNFSFAQNHLSLTRIVARAFGGEITGDADIKNVIASSSVAAAALRQAQLATRASPRGAARPSVQQPATGVQEGSARLRVSNLSLNEVARIISSRSLPLEKLNATGSVTGSVNATWKESVANAFADLTLAIAAPAQSAGNQLPISGSVQGRYSLGAERIELAMLNLVTPRARLQATGSLGSTSASLRVNAAATSLAAFQPMLSAMGNAPLPIELAGSASFDGTLSGRLRSPQIAGHFEAANFTYLYTPSPAVAQAHMQQTGATRNLHPMQTPSPHVPEPSSQPRKIYFDEFVGDIQYSQNSIALHHAILRDGTAQLSLDGSTELDKGSFTDDSQFKVQAVLHNADVAELQHVAGFDYPVSGKLSFSVQAAGTASNPYGHGQLSLVEGEVRGRPVHSLTSKIAFANHTADLEDIHLLAARGTVAGSAAYDFKNREGKVDLKGRSIDIADVPEVQSQHLKVAGVADFTVQGSGSLEHPLVNAHLEIANLVLNDEIIGTLSADATTKGKQLTLTARSKFPKATLTLDGTVQLEGDMPGSAVLHFSNLDVNPFLPAHMRSEVTRQASLDGEAELSGPFKQPRLLHGSLHVKQFSVDVEHIPVKSDGPIELTFANEMISVERCAMSSQDTRFTLTGTIDLRDDRRLDLRAGGSLNLKLAETFDSDLTSYGVANVDLKISGTAVQPAVNGRVEVVHAGLSLIDLPAGLGDLNGSLVFTQDRLQVENLTGRMGGGHIKLGGFVNLGRTLDFDLTVDGKDVRLRYAGFSATSDQTIRLAGSLQNASLTGNVTVTRFAQVPSSDLQLLLAQASAPPSIPNPKSPLNAIHLEVRILSTPELTVETSLAKLSGDVDLRLRGTAARPVLLGRIDIAEGDVKLAGTKYHLQRGDITFTNPVRIDPVLDVEATTRVRDYDITVGLHGTIERLNTTYRSDPPLSTDDIISLLAFGRTQTEQAMGSTTSSPGFAESASGALLSSALNQAVTNRVSKIFGSSAIRINPAFGGWDNDPNARLTLEQQVSNDITFTYVTNLARSAQEIIQIEYNINSEYTLQGIRDENGVVSFDLLIRKRKK
jgi:translocation and assembly module TamB